MTYEQTVFKINQISKFSAESCLYRIRELLEKLGNPQKNLNFVHVAGTNGKGTCSSYIASCLKESGYKTGLYTSPYVEKFTERFKIDGEMIGEQELIQKYEFLKPIADTVKSLSQFEFITALAMLWFAEQKCDVVVLEVGMGGRFDATNVIEQTLVSVIMSISLDHTAILGDSLDKIAFEKAGIIKEKSDLVLYPKQEKEVFDVISKICEERNANLLIPNYEIKVFKEDLQGSKFVVDGVEIEIPFSGKHQIENAITAYEALKIIRKHGFLISNDDLKIGFKNTKITARTELICENPCIILDGGHNEGGAIALEKLIEKNLSDKKITAIIGMMADKDCDAYLSKVAKLFDKIITVGINNPRSMTGKELCEKAKDYCQNVEYCDCVDEAVKLIDKMNFEALVVCGSLFLAGEIRKYLKEIR